MKRTTLAMILASALAAAAAAGCFNPFRPLVGQGVAVAEPAPAATSPQGALRRLRWCWVNRSIAEYEELFTEDFRFVFSDIEAIDNAPILRDEEIDVARRLFVDGGASEPRAKRIDLDFSNSLRPGPDQRAGKMPPWHQQINTGVVLKAELQDQIYDVEGNVVFYLVRGDSALIPDALRKRGFGPDPGHWYIEQWEDKTSSGQGGASLIAHFLDRVRATAPKRRGSGRLSQGSAASQGLTPEFHGTLGGLLLLYR